MRNEKQKNLERFYMDWFIQQIGWKPSLIFEDEEPDFGITIENKTIGIEITGLYKDDTINGSLKKRKENLKSKWLSSVSKEYYKLSDIPIHVKVLTQFGEMNCEPKNIANELIKRNSLAIREEIEFEVELSRHCCIKIWMERLPNEFERYNRWIFIDNHVDWSREINESQLINIIENKSEKLLNYKKKYNEIYLLIIADRTNGSGMFHIINDLVVPSYGFSTIFLVLYPERLIKIS